MFGSAKSSTIDFGLQYAFDHGLAARQVDGRVHEGLSPGACPNAKQNAGRRPTCPTVPLLDADCLRRAGANENTCHPVSTTTEIKYQKQSQSRS